MQDIFYEESVSMRDDRPAKRMYIVFTVLGALCIVFALFALFSLYIVWFFTDAEQTTMTQIIITTVIWVVVMILMIVGAVLMLKNAIPFISATTIRTFPAICAFPKSCTSASASICIRSRKTG